MRNEETLQTGGQNKIGAQRESDRRSCVVHRVGTISLGIMLIGFGVAFLMRLFFPLLSAQQILRYWPAVMIVLGTEVLLAGSGKQDFVVDKAAVILMFLVLFFLFGMAGAEFVLMHFEEMRW
ncbi:MAG: hypothetical protein IJ794_03145 [Lachnospiraceae bacterium]|nr:hypothetical protein [Lachnospiraceae bacterium]